VGTARLIPGRIPDRAEYLRRWSVLHSGLEPSPLVRRWLSICYVCARPLAQIGLAPLVVTVAGVAVAGLVPALAAFGGGWVWLAAVVTVLSGLLDNLDGALAALRERATGFGAVADALADRVADTAYLLALWLLGAPGWLVGLAAGLTFVQEYLRARAAGLGVDEVGVVTVWERPTRVILVAFLLLGCAIQPDVADRIAVAGAGAALAFAVAGIGQLLRFLRRALR
jgi:CDP-diacylglycerol--glycerol-3-phosphate 3-phosphatidyltransferase